MIKKLAALIVILAIPAAIIAWFISAPNYLSEIETAQMDAGNAIAGETMFWAGGCGSCHAKKDAKGDDKILLGGGHRLDTPAGIFITPNISPDKDTGIGNWTGAQFANAMLEGVSPDGSHYFPSFPYTSYTHMEVGDVADLWAFMKTLPVVSRKNEPHDLPFLFSVRRGIGLWKFLFLDKKPANILKNADAQILRGQYLVEGPGHCAECHTPRSLFGLGGTMKSAWLSGAPAAEGSGKTPNITTHADGISWTADEISEYLNSGFTPDFDSVGGSMVSVQENMAKLTKQDRDAIAAYLKAVPPTASN